MANNLYNSLPDLTSQSTSQPAGMDLRRKWMCNHLSLRGKIKRVPGQRPIMMLCLACHEAKQAAKAAADAPQQPAP